MSILDGFFNLGERATGGDPLRMAQFNYYLYWIMFLAFGFILVSNLNMFIGNWKLANLGWVLIMGAMLWFQYNGLKGMRQNYLIMKRCREEHPVKPVEDTPEGEDIGDLVKEHKKKGGKNEKK